MNDVVTVSVHQAQVVEAVVIAGSGAFVALHLKATDRRSQSRSGDARAPAPGAIRVDVFSVSV